VVSKKGGTSKCLVKIFTKLEFDASVYGGGWLKGGA